MLQIHTCETCISKHDHYKTLILATFGSPIFKLLGSSVFRLLRSFIFRLPVVEGFEKAKTQAASQKTELPKIRLLKTGFSEDLGGDQLSIMTEYCGAASDAAVYGCCNFFRGGHHALAISADHTRFRRTSLHPTTPHHATSRDSFYITTTETPPAATKEPPPSGTAEGSWTQKPRRGLRTGLWRNSFCGLWFLSHDNRRRL